MGTTTTTRSDRWRKPGTIFEDKFVVSARRMSGDEAADLDNWSDDPAWLTVRAATPEEVAAHAATLEAQRLEREQRRKESEDQKRREKEERDRALQEFLATRDRLTEGMECTGAKWDTDLTRDANFRLIGEEVVVSYDGDTLRRIEVAGEVAYVVFGHTRYLYGSRRVVEAAWVAEKEKNNISAAASRTWLAKYAECYGAEFHRWNAEQPS